MQEPHDEPRVTGTPTAPEQPEKPEYDKPALDGAGRICGWYDKQGNYHSTWDDNDPMKELYGPNTY